MARARDLKTGIRPEPLVISRTFAAPRALVFKAWSTAEHIKRWFSPAGCSRARCRDRFPRPAASSSSACVCPTARITGHAAPSTRSRRPTGWASPPQSTFAMRTRFTAHTVVTFEDAGAGTRMTVRQDYDIHDPAFLTAVERSAEGWRTTLDKLEREVAAHRKSARSVVHATFSLERIYRASPTAGLPRAVGSGSEGALVRRRRRLGRRSNVRWMCAPAAASARRAAGRAAW